MHSFSAMTSLWIDTAEPARYAALPDGGVDVDVAVIGGGIAGLTTAYLLKRAGKKVAVIEARRILHGETGRTTAFVTALQDVPFRTIASKFGREGARRMASAGMQAIELIEQHVRSLGISCDFERLPAYVYAKERSELAELGVEALAAREAGLDAELVKEVPLPFPVAGAMRVMSQARFHPVKYLMPLAERIVGEGSYIFEDTRAVNVHDGAPCLVETNHGTVRAGAVVGCTDAVTLNRFFLQTKLAPYRTYAIAARCEAELDGLFFDLADPYHYIRTHPDPEGPLLIVGGEDHRVGNEHETDRHHAELEAFMRAHFEAKEIEYTWSGQIEEPVDGLPYIGRNSLSSNVYVATGFSGNGMVNATIAAMILSDAVLGRESAYGAMLSATRLKPLASAKSFLVENAEFPARMVTDRLPAKARSVDAVERGEGKLVAVKGKKVAVYRDEAGALHTLSAACPHLGCHVQWNVEGKSWDCPCHGSRFDATGEVLHGPSTKGLAAVEVGGADEAEEPANQNQTGADLQV